MMYHLKQAGKLIRDSRLERHMTQYELALASGVDQAVILRIERGDTVPNISTVVRLARGMGFEPGLSFEKVNEDKLTKKD